MQPNLHRVKPAGRRLFACDIYPLGEALFLDLVTASITELKGSRVKYAFAFLIKVIVKCSGQYKIKKPAAIVCFKIMDASPLLSLQQSSRWSMRAEN